MATPVFDLQALVQAVDVERVRQGLTWAALAGDVGVAVSTIRRFSSADDAEADGVLALVRWLDAVPEAFVRDSGVSGARLLGTGYGYVRVDMKSVARANGDPQGTSVGTRTTIQNLVAVAQRSGQTVASLTRSSEV